MVWQSASQLIDEVKRMGFGRYGYRGATVPAPAAPAYGPYGYKLGSKPLPEAPSGLDWETVGATMAVAGGLTSLVGALYGVRAEQSKLKAQSLSLQHEQTMLARDARNAEIQAQAIRESGQRDIALTTLAAGAEEGTRRAVTAGRGVQLGVGSTAEVEASGKITKEIDVMALRMNTASAAAAARTRGVNARNASMMAGVSARNLRRSAGNDMLSAAAAGKSLLETGSRLSRTWARIREDEY